MNKQPRKVKITNIKGNVIISSNQSGGTTAHDISTHNDHPVKSKSSFTEWRIWWIIGLISSVLTILGFFGYQYKNNKIEAPLKPNNKSIIISSLNDTTKKQPSRPVSTHKSSPMFKKIKPTIDSSINVNHVTGDVVISKNQSGGITAHTVIVPEDKEIPLENNFSVIDTTFRGFPALKINPLHGSWGRVFISYPDEDDPTTKIGLNSSSGVIMGEKWSSGSLRLKDGQIIKMVVRSVAGPCTPQQSFYITYHNKLPKVITFGDLDDKTKQYSVAF
ncbi:hypothetical protein [Mucilaginibacter jinjuensis]|uniref:Uncharacterized protein n=1 Tax=Mucilaginibacter jinjuensis TaxID=1176721 RepID=A0ABY7T5Z1_9SPHI|nr:hypothetical protein [Mucilaginibacter jinjuensis]WCT11792.1 hypothetical protein PQO05_23970 [Mucilaginibacter jinjuensis]